jgi:hypothetical protein
MEDRLAQQEFRLLGISLYPAILLDLNELPQATLAFSSLREIHVQDKDIIEFRELWWKHGGLTSPLPRTGPEPGINNEGSRPEIS